MRKSARPYPRQSSVARRVELLRMIPIRWWSRPPFDALFDKTSLLTLWKAGWWKRRGWFEAV